MGGVDKAQLRLGGQSLLDHAIARLHPQIEDLAISANGDGARFGGDFTVLADAQPLGPLAGIFAALTWARENGAGGVVSVAVDTPLFPCDLAAHLYSALQDTPKAGLALARSTGRVHGTFGLWRVDLRADLAAFLASGANPRVMDFAARHNSAYADFKDDGAFANINTAEDLAMLQAQFAGAR
jgi:molybdenum cofactor guanylyltransferase